VSKCQGVLGKFESAADADRPGRCLLTPQTRKAPPQARQDTLTRLTQTATRGLSPMTLRTRPLTAVAKQRPERDRALPHRVDGPERNRLVAYSPSYLMHSRNCQPTDAKPFRSGTGPLRFVTARDRAQDPVHDGVGPSAHAGEIGLERKVMKVVRSRIEDQVAPLQQPDHLRNRHRCKEPVEFARALPLRRQKRDFAHSGG
jgi:hypothetical protein